MHIFQTYIVSIRNDKFLEIQVFTDNTEKNVYRIAIDAWFWAKDLQRWCWIVRLSRKKRTHTHKDSGFYYTKFKCIQCACAYFKLDTYQNLILSSSCSLRCLMNQLNKNKTHQSLFTTRREVFVFSSSVCFVGKAAQHVEINQWNK